MNLSQVSSNSIHSIRSIYTITASFVRTLVSLVDNDTLVRMMSISLKPKHKPKVRVLGSFSCPEYRLLQRVCLSFQLAPNSASAPDSFIASILQFLLDLVQIEVRLIADDSVDLRLRRPAIRFRPPRRLVAAIVSPYCT